MEGEIRSKYWNLGILVLEVVVVYTSSKSRKRRNPGTLRLEVVFFYIVALRF